MTSQKTIIANLIFVHINFSDFFSIKGNYFSDATGATGTSSEETSQKCNKVVKCDVTKR